MRPQNALFDRTETPERGKRRNVTWKGHVLLFVVLVLSVVSSSFFLIKTHAAGGSGETSNLQNRYLGSLGDVFPGRVYRGDGRSPEDIFANGFTAQGENYDLVQHVITGDDSGYVSTTGTLSIAETYARTNGEQNVKDIAQKADCSTSQEFFYALLPEIGQFLLGECAKQGSNQVVTARTYVYEIDPAYARNAYHVPTELKANADLYEEYATHDDEWAYVHHVPSEAIVGVHVYTLTANLNPDGTVNMRSIVFANLNQFVANPNYGGTTGRNPRYNPGNDTSSGWNFDTDPDLPTSSCPTNPNVYQHCS